MWILIQTDETGKRKKYITSITYQNILSYINNFYNVKKYDDYHFVSIDKEVIEFTIQLGECLDRR